MDMNLRYSLKALHDLFFATGALLKALTDV